MINVRPGVSYIAMAIAISIVTAIFVMIVLAVAGIDNNSLDATGAASLEDSIKKISPAVYLTVLVGSVAVIFGVTSWLMPPLCGWSAKGAKAGAAAASFN